MASSETGPVASGVHPKAKTPQTTTLIDDIALFEHESCIVRQAAAGRIDIRTETAERLQSSACFDAWAKPDGALDRSPH